MGRLIMYSPKVQERAVRMVLELRGEHRSEWAAICSIAEKFGCSSETSRKGVRNVERTRVCVLRLTAVATRADVADCLVSEAASPHASSAIDNGNWPHREIQPPAPWEPQRIVGRGPGPALVSPDPAEVSPPIEEGFGRVVTDGVLDMPNEDGVVTGLD